MQPPLDLLTPNRRITGMSAMLLPFEFNGRVDWRSFEANLQRTVEAGLTPAVNMDTGYGPLLSEETRVEVLLRTQSGLDGAPFLAGVGVADTPGSSFDRPAYQRGIEVVQKYGGTPILFQSFGLAHQADKEIVANYQALAGDCQSFYAFELGTAFAPFGKIYSLEVYGELMKISNCLGAKHSSLERDLEWERLRLRNQQRPDFLVLTGNDLAIDMVMYGSDYLLGLSAFCPDLFARRDAMWAAGDPDFFQLNDALQALGSFAFRVPVPAYKHDAARFLYARGWVQTKLTHRESTARPDADDQVLYELGRRLGLEMRLP